MTVAEKSYTIKTLAMQCGFSACGITRAQLPKSDANHLQQWLQNGFAANMQYMHRHFEKRVNPALLYNGAQSVIVLLDSYKPENYIFENHHYKISRYALGRDYHKVVKKKLQLLLNKINTEAFTIEGRCFTDTAPLLEKVLAREAGLGWIGKNSLLINKQLGSYVFIGVIVTSDVLAPDQVVNPRCGNCQKCIDACPTGAIVAPGVVDSRKCISYHTIENRDEIPAEIAQNMKGWIFGCDICQQVCPWNNKAATLTENKYKLAESFSGANDSFWQNLSPAQFELLAMGSAIKRCGFNGLKRNIERAKSN